jgi:hypothetical protein
MLRTLVEIAIAITVLEAIALVVYHQATGRGLALRAFGLNLLSGLLLMLALRAALSSGALYWPAAFLAASGLTHAADIWRRWHAD